MPLTVSDRDDPTQFLNFCQQVLPYTYGQHLQDLWFLWETGFTTDGYFIEFGALNGKDFSNTYILEKLGWDGIVAEPHPAYHDLIRENRNCHISTKCVYNTTGDHVTFNMVKGRPALSAISDHKLNDSKSNFRENYIAIDIETITLTDLINESNPPSKIDCLSIDTEGSELEILSAFDFQRHQVNCICVEHNYETRTELFNLIINQGYYRKWSHISGHDDWFVAKGAYPYWSTRKIGRSIRALKELPRFEIALEERIALMEKLTS